MKKMLICLFAAVLAVSMMGCKGDVGSGSGEGGGSGTSEVVIKIKGATETKELGDIVFNDGTAITYSEELTLTDEQKSKAIAVIYKVDGNKAYGVGLVHNKTGLAWCLDSANGYNVLFTGIQSGCAGDFYGDLDGSDNFTIIAQTLGNDDDTEIVGNYPAFEFAKNYKKQENSHVNETAYEDLWYLPSGAELLDIWKEKTTVNKASILCGGSQFDDVIYWSSSQYQDVDVIAWRVDFSNGNTLATNKWKPYNVCCIRVF